MEASHFNEKGDFFLIIINGLIMDDRKDDLFGLSSKQLEKLDQYHLLHGYFNYDPVEVEVQTSHKGLARINT